MIHYTPFLREATTDPYPLYRRLLEEAEIPSSSSRATFARNVSPISASISSPATMSVICDSSGC